MFKATLLLTKLQICNFFGINEARFARDPKKKSRVKTTMIAFLIMGIAIVVYAASLSYALASFGFSEIVPLYLGLMAFGIIFGLSVYRAGTIFDVKSYEKLSVLPVSQAAIVASKFLSLYIANFLFAFVVTASGAIATSVAMGFDLWFVLSMILSSIFLPLLPIALALLIGTAIYAIVSRFKKNNFLKTLLTSVFVVALVAFPSLIDSQATDLELITDIAAIMSSIGNVFAPLNWLAAGTRVSGIGYYFLFALVSLAAFAAYSFVVGKFYKNICSALSANGASASFKMSEQTAKKPLFALYKRELKRYVSVSIYFMNTCMGNLMAVVLSIAVVCVGVDEILTPLGIPMALVQSVVPFLIAGIVNLSPMTCCAISMEGKGWEQTKCLPVSVKTVMLAKLLVQWTFSVPASLICSILFSIALGVTVWIFVIPLAAAFLLAVVALFINAKYPCLEWDNPTVPVKQASSTLLSMLATFGVLIVSAVATVAAGQKFAPLVIALFAAAYVAVGVIFYKKVTSIRLNEIDGR